MDTSQIIHEITDTSMQLAPIPHPSGQEQAFSTHLANLLRSRGGTVEMDDHGNLRGDFPATAGLDSAPMVCIQGHSDMVYVTQPCSVHCRVQDGWLESDGRSPLGAGSLLALTAALWLLQQPFAHGPGRILLTTGGEQGMTGAQVINLSMAQRNALSHRHRWTSARSADHRRQRRLLRQSSNHLLTTTETAGTLLEGDLHRLPWWTFCP
ncbi:MAG: hypothetical protein V8S71_09105 [Oscillospiraceae bacterium]